MKINKKQVFIPSAIATGIFGMCEIDVLSVLIHDQNKQAISKSQQINTPYSNGTNTMAVSVINNSIIDATNSIKGLVSRYQHE